MRRFDNTGEAALYLWDYFYLQVAPTESEEKPWRRIECATFRIRESEPYLADKYPATVRVRNARRVRRATREILRCIPQLETVPELWIASVLAHFEALSDSIISELQEEAAGLPLH